MDKFILYGGETLQGEVSVSGAKNAVLKLIIACLLNRGQTHLQNVPRLRDVFTSMKILEEMGAVVEWEGENLWVDTSQVNHFEANYDLVRTMRASILVLGPLVARYGKAKVSLPGGCAIGERPIEQHLNGLEKMGVQIELRGGYIEASCKKLRGASICLDYPTVGGTENLMMAASLAQGRTLIENAAREPEIIELANFINKMGGKIEGAGTDMIVIEGVEELFAPSEPHRVMSDRIEAGTLLIAGAITGGDVWVKDVPVAGMEMIFSKLRAAGVQLDIEGTSVRVRRTGEIRSVDIRTLPFPGFPTDMQAQFMALMTLSNGRSTISETVFENRFMHVSELRRMGADIICEGAMAVIRGVNHLGGAPVMATDLRASAGLVLAGLVAKGVTEIRRIYHLDRGYDAIEKKLLQLGAKIQRING